jgi:hypothetical protein
MRIDFPLENIKKRTLVISSLLSKQMILKLIWTFYLMRSFIMSLSTFIARRNEKGRKRNEILTETLWTD